ASAFCSDEGAYLARIGEDYVSAVTHHARRQQGRCALFGATVTGVGLQAEIMLPKLTRLAVGGRDCVGVFAVRNGLHTLRRIELLEILFLPAASSHSPHCTALLSCM